MRARLSKSTNTKRCPMCGETKSYDEYNLYKSGKQIGQPQSRCRKCATIYNREQNHKTGRTRPMMVSKGCATFLGEISETLLGKMFNNVIRMPHNHKGFDFLCDHGLPVDVKSSCLRHPLGRTPRWAFSILKNKTPRYFVLVAFDSRGLLNLEHVWIIPADIINNIIVLDIPNNPESLLRWSKYEKSLTEYTKCWNVIKQEL